MFSRVFTDMLAAVLIVASFAYGFTGATAHEWLGCGACAALAAHNALNRRWWEKTFAGTLNLFNAGMLALNIALAASVIAVAVSGMMLSGEIFPFVPSGEGLFARRIHTASAAWLFVFGAFHAGLHAAFFAGAARKVLRLPSRRFVGGNASVSRFLKTTFSRAIAGTLAILGAAAFFRRAFPQKLFAQETFDRFAFGDALPSFLADYAFVAALFFLLGAWARQSKKRESPPSA